ncbi:MAG TPA: hypothetical protein PLX15_00580 [Candidatus Woesearchaeota archaeon]|nr:hypothetical protein [Candidatus Woesearchaeota archaeon]
MPPKIPEKHHVSLLSAKQNIKVADHMMNVTYPLVMDPKLFPTIIENIFLGYTNALAAILYYERYYKRIPPFNDSFDSKLMFYETYVKEQYKFNNHYSKTMNNLRELMIAHKKSPVEFSRKGKFVICNDEYSLKTLDIDTVKSYIRECKVFISEIDKIIAKEVKIY